MDWDTALIGGGGRNRTHRTGSTRPTRFEDEGGHQTPYTSGFGLPPVGSATFRLLRVAAAPTIVLISAPVATNKGNHMKKLLIILILAAIGIAVAKKVREA